MLESRYLQTPIVNDLAEKMVFLAGPRQVGKTTLARSVQASMGGGQYYSWDRAADRKLLLKGTWPTDASMIILDEIHKYRLWKRWIKGEYDHHKDRLKFLVTGSARMDVFRRGGDSLMGRYHHLRLHPFSVSELSNTTPNLKPMAALEFSESTPRGLVENLLQFGGFPEPFLKHSEAGHRRWSNERLERLIREDVRDLENIRDLSSMQLLADLIPERVASLLSLNSLREDLEVSHRAVTSWIEILERMYYLFRIGPYESNRIRGLKKETKAYLWDWSQVPSEGERLENLIASHLLKTCHFLSDTEGYKAELFYLRDKRKQEVDFIVTIDRKPWFAVEVKQSDTHLSPALLYFKQQLKIPFAYQVVGQPDKEWIGPDKIEIISAKRFLSGLV